MPIPVHVPRVNNNDDEVKLVELKVELGAHVSAGQVLASVETDKAVVDVEAPAAGFVIAIGAQLDAMAQVGSVLLWLGSTADEAPPTAAALAANDGDSDRELAPTAKARALLLQHGLSADQVPASAGRLSAEDVARFVASRGALAAAAPAAGKEPRSETKRATSSALSRPADAGT